MTIDIPRDTLFPLSPTTTDDVVTPSWVFDALGIGFDLDPCGVVGGDSVPATRRFTIEDDGLSKQWEGRVWMNPPFSKPKPWVERFMEHRSGIMLSVVSRAYWCLELWRVADFVAFPHKPFGFTSSGFLYPIMFAGYGQEEFDAVSSLATPRRLV